MIDIDDDGQGRVEIWLKLPAARWPRARDRVLLASGPTVLSALVDAEKMLRDELTTVHEHLHRAKEAARPV